MTNDTLKVVQPVPPRPGLIVKTPSGELGMIVRTGTNDYTVQVFAEGQQWVPMALSPIRDDDDDE